MLNINHKIDFYEYAIKRCVQYGMKAEAKYYYFLLLNLLGN